MPVPMPNKASSAAASQRRRGCSQSWGDGAAALSALWRELVPARVRARVLEDVAAQRPLGGLVEFLRRPQGFGCCHVQLAPGRGRIIQRRTREEAERVFQN